MKSGGLVALVSLLIEILLVAVPSRAASASPRRQLEDFFGSAATVLSGASDARRAEEDIRHLAEPLFDVPGATRRLLGPEWGALSIVERKELIRLFGDRLLRAYLGMVRAKLPRDRPPLIRVVGEEVGASGRAALVRTMVLAKDGTDVRFDYLMTRAGANWLVHDVVVEDLSLIENYRAQVAQVLRASSYAGLLARLRPETDIAARASAWQPVVAYFKMGRADLEPASLGDLEAAAAWLKSNGQMRIVVEGHADDQGDPRTNSAIAVRRAAAVRDGLVSLGVHAERIGLVSHADRRPVCRESRETCWARNRRAVLRITPDSSAPAGRPAPAPTVQRAVAQQAETP